MAFLLAIPLVPLCGCGDDASQGTDTGTATAATTDDVTTTQGSTSTSETTGTTSDTSGTTTGTDTSGSESTTTGPIIDCMRDTDTGGRVMFDFSFIWIANSGNGTVSKIATETAVEEGRYRTDPEVTSSPSRTSVDLAGRFAVVSNRVTGSITKFAANTDDCIDRNNDDVIQTSTGPNDVLAWNEDECMIWRTAVSPFDGGSSNGPRPTAWDAGVLNERTCQYHNAKVWVGWYTQDKSQGTFWRLAGADGAMLDEVQIPWNGNMWGPYGGAVDKNNDFWAIGWEGPLVRIDGQNLDWQKWEDPILDQVYGMALDRDGNPWFGSCDGRIIFFDAQNEAFQDLGDTGGCARGLQIDTQGRAWIAGNAPARLIEVDTIAKVITNPNIGLLGAILPVGVSIDAEGFVWLPDMNGNFAFKVNPNNYDTVTVDGLDTPYTYSDMTGAGLNLQTQPF